MALENGCKSLEELLNERPSFQEALISTKVIEAAHESLKSHSSWKMIKV